LELLGDAKRILSDKLSAARFSRRFLEYFDGEFPLTVTLENFMKKRNYRIALPDEKPW
jgi:hypothetical protein